MGSSDVANAGDVFAWAAWNCGLPTFARPPVLLPSQSLPLVGLRAYGRQSPLCLSYCAVLRGRLSPMYRKAQCVLSVSSIPEEIQLPRWRSWESPGKQPLVWGDPGDDRSLGANRRRLHTGSLGTQIFNLQSRGEGREEGAQ